MRAYDMIKKKRDGGELSALEIRGFMEGYVQGEITDEQAAAFCMAVYFRGMTAEEAISRIKGIRCGFKNTSCPDQLAQALKQALQQD